jgi:hypothetical protein
MVKILLLFIYFQISFAEHLANIRILSMNRPNSLSRLLASLSNAYYEKDKINLEIYIDASADTNKPCNDTISIANNYKWNIGEKFVMVNTKNLGHIKQWFQRPRSAKPFFIIEDDIILSPFFYIIVKDSLSKIKSMKYKNLIGISLQKLSYVIINDNCKHFRPEKCIEKGKIPINHAYFLNQFAPWAPFVFSDKWNELVDFYEKNEKKKPKEVHCIPKAISNRWYNASDTFIQYFMYKKGYFLMFFNTKTEIAHNFLEKGLHFNGENIANQYDLFKTPIDELKFSEKFFFDLGFNALNDTKITLPSTSVLALTKLQKCKIRM